MTTSAAMGSGGGSRGWSWGPRSPLKAARRSPRRTRRDATEDVARPVGVDDDARRDLGLPPPGQVGELRQGGDGVVLGVERQCRVVLGVAPAVREPGLLLVEVAAVGEDNAREAPGAGGGEHRTGEAVVHQAGHVPAVVDVGVGEHDRVERRRVDGQWGQVALAEVLRPLVQPAVHEGRDARRPRSGA